MQVCPNCRRQNEFEIESKCRNCNWSLQYKDGVPLYLSDEDINSDEFQSYFRDYEAMSVNNLNAIKEYGSYLRMQNDKLYSYCGKLMNKKVCEVGFGRGYLLKKIAADLPKKLVGIDISPVYINRIKNELSALNNIELIMANAENIPYRDEFDCIIASDILEHVLNPGNFIFCVNQALRKGGNFIVRVPCNENILTYSKYMGCQYKFAHLRNFNKASLKAILHNSGFKIKKIHYDGYLADRKRPLFKKSKLLNKIFENIVDNFSEQDGVINLNNRVSRVLMKPIEITVVCEKVKELVPRVEVPQIKIMQLENKQSYLEWTYENYSPNIGYGFILNISDKTGKIYYSHHVGDRLNCNVDLYFLNEPQCYKANIYATYEGETITGPSKDYEFDYI